MSPALAAAAVIGLVVPRIVIRPTPRRDPVVVASILGGGLAALILLNP